MPNRLPSIPFLRASIAIGALLLAICSQWLGASSPLRMADESVRDRILKLRVDARPETRILVVDIDETSLLEHPWPWSRSRMAELIETLLEGGARGVALDIVQEKAADPGGDTRMAMLAEHGPLVVAQLFDYEQRQLGLRSGQLIGGVALPKGSPAAVPAYGYMAGHAGLARAAHAGNIGVLSDPDGVLRHVPMYTDYAGRRYPTLSRALFDCCAGPPQLNGNPAQGFTRIPYSRSWEAYTVANADEVLNQQVPPALIAGRLVLIGSSSLSVGDRVATPLLPNNAGLLVHAAMLSSLLDQQAGLAPAAWPGRVIAIVFSVLVIGMASFTLPRLSAAANVALLGTAALLWLGMVWALVPHDPLFSPSGPLMAIAFLLTIGVPFHWQQSQQTSRQLLGTLRQYVATEVVDELLRSNLKDPLTPRQLQVTTLIADMEGYTSHVESLPVEDAALLTTQFLDCLTRPVLDNHGTLDKYTGDGLVAFWGAPLPNPNHADLALDAAQQILLAVQRLSKRRAAEGKAPLRVRIGIESGLAMAGDYGSTFRSIYTAVGDSVNTASRLEQAARDFPHDVIIGEGTVNSSVRHRFTLLGEHHLRGKEKLVKLYTLEQTA